MVAAAQIEHISMQLGCWTDGSDSGDMKWHDGIKQNVARSFVPQSGGCRFCPEDRQRCSCA